MKRSSCAGSPSRYASLDSPGRKTACIGLPPRSAWIQPSRVLSSVRAQSPTTLVPKAELGTSRTILHTFLSEKKSSPVNCILLKNPFASKKNGSLRQPENRRQSPAVVATASRPTDLTRGVIERCPRGQTAVGPFQPSVAIFAILRLRIGPVTNDSA